MPLKLGVDFGTATMCAAAIRDATTLIPDVIPVDGNRLNESAVWFEWESELPIIVRSDGKHPRHPVRIFRQATDDFARYWQNRVRAQKELRAWDEWLERNREGSMLLTYFKPELADEPVMHARRVVVASGGSFDPIRQSEDRWEYTELRSIADPAPDTDDYVAGTAALLRTVAEAASRRFGEKIQRLVVGVPSLDDAHDGAELKRAKQRRDAAIRLAGIKTDFGTSDFAVQYCGEAFAAANGVQIRPGAKRVLVVIIDIGAGTTDFGLVEYRESKAGRMEATDELYHSSIRTAGRDLNVAIAEHLKERMDIREAFRAMDERSWQVLLDEDMERIKRELSKGEDYFRIDLKRLAAHWNGCVVDEAQRQRLNRVLGFSIEEEELRASLSRFALEWERGFADFLVGIEQSHKGALTEVSAISIVGGAARFPLMLEIVQCAIDKGPLKGKVADYQDSSGEAQTAVARGLARRAFLET